MAGSAELVVAEVARIAQAGLGRGIVSAVWIARQTGRSNHEVSTRASTVSSVPISLWVADRHAASSVKRLSCWALAPVIHLHEPKIAETGSAAVERVGVAGRASAPN